MDYMEYGTQSASLSIKSLFTKSASFLFLAIFLTACGGGGGGGGDDDDNGDDSSDTTAPTISLIGANPIQFLMSGGGSYTDPGATASDNVDGDITANIIVGGDTVETDTPDTYTITYNVTDAAGNVATEVTRDVEVIDDVLPVIQLVSNSSITLPVGGTYTESGATASDNVDGDISASITIGGDSVNTATADTYTLTYDVSDAAGNAAIQVTRTVTVSSDPVDTEDPVITVTGDNPYQFLMSSGNTYSDPGATASDNVDGNLTGSIQTTGVGDVDTSIPGDYDVTYTVTDAAGNTDQAIRTVTVVDDVAPAIAILGDNPYEVSRNTTYADPGVSATDNVDGDISASVTNDSGTEVDMTVIDSYTVTYNVDDAAGNPATPATRVVNVVNNPPVINSFGVSPNPVFVNSSASFSWDVSDANSDSLTCSLDIDDDGIEDYDCANSTSQTHTFTVAGDYTASLTVDDGIAAPVESTLDFTVVSPLATDVSVEGPLVAGQRALYTITVANTTTQPIQNVQVSFIVPTELSFHYQYNVAPNTSGSCNGSSNCTDGREAVWSVTTLNPGESRTIMVDALVDADTLDGVDVTLPVVFSGEGISNIQIDKVVTVYSDPSADLSLGASKDPVVPSESFTYYLDVGNTSAGTLTNTTLTAYLPAGITVDSVSDNANAVVTGNEVVWTIGSVAVGESLHRTISVTTDAVLTDGTILKARAELMHDDDDTGVDNAAEYSITVEADTSVPLQVEIDVENNPVIVGDRVIYTVTVGNVSALPVDNVNVLVRVPAELSFHYQYNVEPNTMSSCSGFSSCTTGREAVWSLDTLVSGETRTITIDALVETSAETLDGNLITLPVRVTADDLEDHMDLRKTVVVYSDPSADLSLGASKDPVVPSESFTYYLDVGNTSAGTLTNTTLTAYLPAGITVDSVSDNANAVVTGNEVVWTIGSVAVGESLHRTISVTTDAVLTDGTILKARAELMHDDDDTGVDNAAEYSITVEADTSVPLQVEIDVENNPVIVGDRVIYTVTVGNVSALPVDNVNVLVRVPAELSFHYQYNVEPSTASSCSGYISCTTGREAVWSLDTLVSGETRTITIDALVETSEETLDGNLITLPVRVTADDLEDHMDLRKTVAVYSDPSADLSLGASKDPVVPSESFTYYLDVGNTSAGTLTNTTLTAYLPAGITVDSVSDNANAVVTGNEVVWTIGSVAVGESLHRTISVTTDAVLTDGTILKARAELMHDDDDTGVDNAAEYSITVEADTSVPLQVEIDVESNPVIVGDRVIYTVTVGNVSALPVDNVNVLVRVPAELSFHHQYNVEPNTASSCSGFYSCTTGREAIWSLDTLVSGETRTITIDALVETSAETLDGNLITLPVRVTADDLEDHMDLRKTVAAYSDPSADLSLGASKDPVVPSESFTYYLDVGNTSAGTLTNTTLTAYLPDGVTVDSVNDAANAAVTGNEVVWTIGSVGVGSIVSREVTVTANSVVEGQSLKIMAELAHDGELESDRKSEFSVTVVEDLSSADLLDVAIVATPDPVASNAVVNYSITLTNGYGLAIDNVYVLLRVPNELSFHFQDDVTPNTTQSCSGYYTCAIGREAVWHITSLGAGGEQQISINASVGSGIDDGNLIVAPIRVIGDGIVDVLNYQVVTGIQN